MNDVVARARALREVLSIREITEPPYHLAESVVSCAKALSAAGEANEALSLLDRADRLTPLVDSEWHLRIGIARVTALRKMRRFDDCLAMHTDLAKQYAGQLERFTTESIALRIERGALLWRMNRVDESLELLLALRRELLLLPDSSHLARCAFHLSTAYYFRGERDVAHRLALEALVSARRSGDSQYEGLALDNVARVERMAGRFATSEEYGRAALQIAEAGGFRLQALVCLRCLGICDWKRGRLVSAMSRATTSRNSATTIGNGFEEWLSSLLVGMIHLHAGKYTEAQSSLSKRDDWLIPRANSRASLLTTEFLGDVHLEQEQAEEALKHYDEVWPKALALVPKGDIVAELRHRRAECYLLLGQFPAAYEEAQTGLQHCRELGDRYEEAATYRVLALAASAVGKPDEAKQWFDQGFAYYEDIETPFEWGKLWMSYGDWLAGPNAGAHGDKRAALDAYRAAEEHFERMGAEGKLAMARARLQALSGTMGNAQTGSERTLRDRLRAPRRPRITAELERRASWAHEAFGTVTRNRSLLDTLAQCAKLAEGNLPILVLGESGTGKELVAQGIHRLSSRRGQYLPLNCSAIPHEVFESELFGHVAGAFTGATRDKAGIFEVCDGGTVFLDEIGEMPLELQARLLRYLESGEFRRVGSSRNLRADTRLVAATNRDRSSLKSGQGFRTDLYYRLAHAVVTLPPLRQRGDDVELLIGHFLERAAEDARKAVFLSDEAWGKLIDHPWPGNIRELRSTIQRIVLLATPGAEVVADSFELDDTDVPTNLAEETVLVEKRRIEDALQKASGNKSEAARLLGLSRTTMLSKMKRYGMAD